MTLGLRRFCSLVSGRLSQRSALGRRGGGGKSRPCGVSRSSSMPRPVGRPALSSTREAAARQARELEAHPLGAVDREAVAEAVGDRRRRRAGGKRASRMLPATLTSLGVGDSHSGSEAVGDQQTPRCPRPRPGVRRPRRTAAGARGPRNRAPDAGRRWRRSCRDSASPGSSARAAARRTSADR